jgi:hypothetical protein
LEAIFVPLEGKFLRIALFIVRITLNLKKLRRAEGGAKMFGVFRVKNHDFTPKNNIFPNTFLQQVEITLSKCLRI